MLSPNFKEAPELNTKLPNPETTWPAKLTVPFTVIVLPVPMEKSALIATTFPEEMILLFVFVGAAVAVFQLVPSKYCQLVLFEVLTSPIDL